MSAVGDSGARTKSSGDVDNLGKFLLGYTGLQGLLPMHFDAIGTLRGESHGDRHEFLVLLRDRSIGKRSLVVGAESGHCLRGELAHLGERTKIVNRVHSFQFLSVAIISRASQSPQGIRHRPWWCRPRLCYVRTIG